MEQWKHLSATAERLAEVASALESAAARLEQCGEQQAGEVGRITAAIESHLPDTAHLRKEAELERKLAEALQAVERLEAGMERKAAEDAAGSGRKTLPAATVQLLAKQGMDAGDTMNVQSLDIALAGMSVEERIAVKSQMWRAGSLTL